MMVPTHIMNNVPKCVLGFTVSSSRAILTFCGYVKTRKSYRLHCYYVIHALYECSTDIFCCSFHISTVVLVTLT
jgi:hypothetical protein